MTTIAIVSQKGGTGKTTLAIHLAAAAERRGEVALVIDADPQATASQWAAWREEAPPEVIDSAPPRIAAKIEQAKEAGLVDEIGFIEEAVDRAIELAGLDRNNVQVIRYKRTLSLGSLLLGANAQGRAFDLAQMIDMCAPRPYYLATQLPLLVRSGD